MGSAFSKELTLCGGSAVAFDAVDAIATRFHVIRGAADGVAGGQQDDRAAQREHGYELLHGVSPSYFRHATIRAPTRIQPQTV